MYIKISIFFLLTTLITSCGTSTQESAEESLIGEWDVTQIFESYITLDNGVQIDQSQTTFEETEGFSGVKIDNAVISDAGIYTLNLSNNLGSVEISCDVNIHGNNLLRVCSHSIKNGQHNT